MMISKETPALPHADKVDVGKLEAVFKSRVNSYKFLLFKAILELLDRRRGVSTRSIIYLSDLRLEMLLNAWFAVRYYRLSFGERDQIGKKLDSILSHQTFKNAQKLSAEGIRNYFAKHSEQIDAILQRQNVDITHYVVYRLLTPWFENILKRLPDGRKNKLILEKCNDLYESRIPLYKIDATGKKIELHPRWVDYLDTNFGIVNGWLDMHWLRYLFFRNPHVPGLASKLWSTQSRGSLLVQRRLWNSILKDGFTCIYTDKEVSPDKFALDHFLPWSWIGHDQLWNLVPVSQEVNSSKGSMLPQEAEIDKLAIAHFRLLKVQFVKSRTRSKFVEEYIAGLSIDTESMFDKEKLVSAYLNTLTPLISHAKKRGFETWQKEQRGLFTNT